MSITKKLINIYFLIIAILVGVTFSDTDKFHKGVKELSTDLTAGYSLESQKSDDYIKESHGVELHFSFDLNFYLKNAFYLGPNASCDFDIVGFGLNLGKVFNTKSVVCPVIGLTESIKTHIRSRTLYLCSEGFAGLKINITKGAFLNVSLLYENRSAFKSKILRHKLYTNVGISAIF